MDVTRVPRATVRVKAELGLWGENETALLLMILVTLAWFRFTGVFDLLLPNLT